MRKKIVAGNWKMNMTLEQSTALIKGLKEELQNFQYDNTRVILAPSFISLSAAVNETSKVNIEIAAQNMSQEKRGAFTGEVSAEMLAAVGVDIVIIGHSERRTYFQEIDAGLKAKTKAALTNNFDVIFCFGEQLEDRENKQHFEVVEQQLKNALFELEAEDFGNIILAYEPVWAIGTGKTASADEAQEMHAFIRSILVKQYNEKLANSVSILYGGSVKPNNAAEIFSKSDVDGGLIGGASLKAKDFSEIVKAI